MSMSPSGTAWSSRSQTSSCRRVAGWAPRRGMAPGAAGRGRGVGGCAPSAVDAHEGDRATAVLLDHLMRDAHERAADVVLVEDDLRIGQHVPSWPLRTGLKGLAGTVAAR